MANKKLVDLDGLKEYHKKLKDDIGSLVPSNVESIDTSDIDMVVFNTTIRDSLYLDLDLFTVDSNDENVYTSSNFTLITLFENVNGYFYNLGASYIMSFYTTGEQGIYSTGLATPLEHNEVSVDMGSNTHASVEITTDENNNNVIKVTFIHENQN